MIIQGSEINLNALAGVKSKEDLEKLELFTHLPNAKEANTELWEAINPKKKKETEKQQGE
jgi:hypothetical protein